MLVEIKLVKFLNLF